MNVSTTGKQLCNDYPVELQPVDCVTSSTGLLGWHYPSTQRQTRPIFTRREITAVCVQTNNFLGIPGYGCGGERFVGSPPFLLDHSQKEVKLLVD